jgi:hypothetical protein
MWIFSFLKCSSSCIFTTCSTKATSISPFSHSTDLDIARNQPCYVHILGKCSRKLTSNGRPNKHRRKICEEGGPWLCWHISEHSALLCDDCTRVSLSQTNLQREIQQ